jgi:DNA primase
MLGYAPPSGDPLAFHLKKQGYALQDAREVFVVDQDGTGAFFDKFRGRLMFPIHDERGNVIAFGGRVLGDEIPKYINSSDTPLYRKSRVLYGFHLAKESISKRRSALLVEGYLDVIACHEAGLTHAVASLGTSATEEQAKLLKRWSDEVVILYDRDEAGQKAADRAIAVMSAEGLRVRVAVLPPGEDPDSLLKKHGAGAVTKVAEAGLPPLDFKIRRIEERLNPAQEEFWQEVISVLATETNELELDRQLVRLAPSYPGLVDSVATQKTLKRTIARVRREKASQERNPDFIKSIRTTTISRSVKDLHSAEVVLFKAFLNSEYRTRAFLFVRKHDLFLSSAGLELAETLTKTFPEQPPTGEPPLWLPKIESDTHRQLLADINDDMRGDILTEDYLADSLMQMRDLIALREAQVQRPKLQSDDERQKYLERLRQLKPTVDDPGDLLKDW